MAEIDFSNLEKKWQDKWADAKIFEAKENSDKPKYYMLEMFPYPSGAGLHMGHAWNYTIGDILARFKILNGFNVLHPMGYDALGLPAENAAIKAGTHPEEYTNNSIEDFTKQFKGLGISYDWSRMVNTANPDYYKWDQWIFLKMFEKGLAYQKESAVNWCPNCNTVLANEQVHEGKCWRHEDTPVEIKHLKQWFLKITDYADELYENLDNMDWPDKTRAMQKNWIGKSHGTEIDFEIINPDKEKILYDKIYFASGNKAKLERLKKVFAAAGLGIEIELVPDFVDVEETGKNVLENSLQKILPYKNKYSCPVIAMDTAAFFDGEDFDPTHMKRICLDGKDGKDFTQEEIADMIKNFYANIAKKYGGEKDFYFEDGWTILFPDGSYKQDSYKREYILTDKLHGELDIYFPMRSLYLVRSTCKNPCEQNDNDWAKEFEGQINLMKKFFSSNETWPVFTTRPDTIFGVTFVVVSAQHKKLFDLITNEQKTEVEEFLKKLGSVSEKELADMEKMGVFTGSYAINPATGEKVPVYAGNFVVADYGSGMVMAVPAHDQRDFDFAKKYGIEIKQVIYQKPLESNKIDMIDQKTIHAYKFFSGNPELDMEKELELDNITERKDFWAGEGFLINSSEFDGMWNVEAKEKITEWLSEKNKARKVVNFKLRDWGISRQRYWGTPIPIIHCPKCGAVAVPENDLPVKLPHDVKFGEGNPLETNEDWIKTTCPKCGGEAERETDTMDTFVNSSWYMFRYCDPENNNEIFDKEKVKYWCPVDTYIGGPEHACMHLIYSRFYTKFLRDLGLLDFDEPAKKLIHQGMINAEDGGKMSKSKGNVINPLEKIEKYGSDTLRFFMVSMASIDKGFDWSENGIVGSSKFVNKVLDYFDKWEEGNDNEEILSKLNKTINNVTLYFENFEYRKATIELRELFDVIEKNSSSKETLNKFLQILNPICPHITEELWEKLGNDKFISNSSWPKADESKIQSKKQIGDLNEKAIEDIKYVTEKFEGDFDKIYLYVMPFELNKIDLNKIASEVGKEIKIFAVNDKEKFDPENKAKKAKPGKVSIYLE